MLFLLFLVDDLNDASPVHYDDLVSVFDGLAHVVSDHQTGNAVVFYDPAGQFHHFLGTAWIQNCSVFIAYGCQALRIG